MHERIHEALVAVCSYVLLLGAAAGCHTAPTGPIPDPLPETVAWVRAEEPVAGAFLGIEGRENDSGSLEALSFSPGLKVVEVVEGSPAKRAGVQVGDVLLRWDDVALDDPETLAALLSRAQGGEQPTLHIRRGDSVFDVPIELRARETSTVGQAELAWRIDPARSRAGWLTGRGGAVLVTSDQDGPFPDAGVPISSVVVALDGQPVRSARGLIRALQSRDPGSRVEVDYLAKGQSEVRSADVRLYEPRRRVTEATLPVLAGYHSSADGETSVAYLLDLYFISLFRYRREGPEREFRFLRFIRFSTGVGELTETVR